MYAALESPTSPADVGTVEVTSYTPVASSVKALHARISGNGLLLSSLARLQALVPVVVSERALQAAEQAQSLGITYAAPLVTLADNKINGVIITAKALPAYGQAKVAQADELAFSLTPKMLKPTYTASRGIVVGAVNKTVELADNTVSRAQAIKFERQQQLHLLVEQVQTQITSLRSAVEKSSVQARDALHLEARLTDLHNKVNRAVSLASEKRTQARHLSQELLQSVSDLTLQLTTYLETSYLTQSQRDIVHSLWNKLVERVNGLKAQLYGSPVSSASSSRSDSCADAQVAALEAEANVAESVDAVASASESSSSSADEVSSSLSLESESKTAPDSGAKKAGAGKKSKQPKKQQQELEQKEKIAAEEN